MKKSIIIFLLLLILCGSMLVLLFEQNEDMNVLNQKLQEYESQSLIDTKNTKEIIDALKNENAKLTEENDILLSEKQEGGTMDYASSLWLKEKGFKDERIISKDLAAHPELIPYEGVLGGIMSFSKIFILNDHWAYARFDDGHIEGYALFEYTIDDKQKVSWKIIDSILDGSE